MKSNPKFQPPKLALRFLRWFCNPRLLEDVEGDVTELFELWAVENPRRAKLLFIKEILFLFRPGIIKPLKIISRFKNTVMLKNHFSVAYRFALRHKGSTLLNLLGLIVGMAATIILLLWVDDEVKMNQFHADGDSIYQVLRNMHQSSGEINTTSSIPQPLELVLENDYPEVEKVTLMSWPMEAVMQFEDQTFYESGRYTSPEFFEVFTYPFLIGDQESAFDDLSSIMISESLATKLFGSNWKEKAIGKTIKVDNRKDFSVSGVFKDAGIHSSIQFDWVIPAQEYIQRNDWVTSWFNGGFSIFFKLKENADIALTQEKILQEINVNTNYDADERLYLQAFNETYLHNKFENGVPVGGRILYVRIFFIVAIFMLIIACINFTNLATAQANLRAREIGIRKVMGAQKGGLRWQFFSESYLLSLISIIFAVILVFAFLPYFNDVTGKELSLNLFSPKILLGLVAVLLVTGLLSGSYPALLMSSFKTTRSLKGGLKHAPGAVFFRKGLVTFQFALSILLIIGTIVVYQQMQYILNKDLGLDRENLVFIEMERDLANNQEIYKDELEQLPGVQSVTSTSGNPISYGRSTGGAEWDGKDPTENVEINVMNVDPAFIQTTRINILKGRDFSIDFKTDSANYLINEVAAKVMGFEDPIDKNLTVYGLKGKVIGLVKNFHMDSMFEPIEPLIIRCDPKSTFLTLVRTQGNIKGALKAVEKATLQHSPGLPFRYTFMDETYEASYKSEMTLSKLTNIFAFISIFISCLGLLGLSSFSVSQRAKEIGIRKVYGAEVAQLVFMLSKDYAKLIVLAFVFAAPIAYIVMQDWLDSFIFRADMSIVVFIISGILVFLIGTLIVSLRSYQAATVDPVVTLQEK